MAAAAPQQRRMRARGGSRALRTALLAGACAAASAGAADARLWSAVATLDGPEVRRAMLVRRTRGAHPLARCSFALTGERRRRAERAVGRRHARLSRRSAAV
jgi:hypothetical protein